MKNLLDTEYTDDRIKKMGYIAICGVLRELLISGKRIAVMKELRSIKMLIDPTNVDLEEDMELLQILKEPHVKLASEIVEFTYHEVLIPYSLLTVVEDEDVVDDNWSFDRGWDLVYRFMFNRQNPRRRDRYTNFTRVLKCLQRVIYEFLKLSITGETRMLDRTYRTNYTQGRVNVLMVGNTDSVAIMLVGLIDKLKEAEMRSIELMDG